MKKVQDLRNKVLYATGFVEARKLVMKRPGRAPLVLEKKDDLWLVQAPDGKKLEADEDTVRQMLNTVNGARILEFIDRPNDAELGLGANNRGSFEIWPSDNGPSVVIVLGRKVRDKPRLYVRRMDKPYAAVLMEYFDRDTDKKWSDFRDKNVMKFEVSEAVQLEVGKPGLTLTYQKNPDGVWLSPGRDKANDEAVNIASALADCRVQSFADGATPASAGIDKPLLTAKITLKDGKVRDFRFGKREGDKIYLASDKGEDIFLVLPQAANNIENALAPASAAPAK
jgi:hypothetical protein